jgi:formylglycine-generating enzyme required for sulfatase activity
MRLLLAAVTLTMALTALTAHAVEVWREPHTGMEFVALPKACYPMGVPAGAFREADPGFQKRIRVEMPQHEVCLDAFWIGRHEVREADWRKLMGEHGTEVPDDAPVAGVSWTQANAFVRRLNEVSAGAAHFRLPTEAEWEYACRAGAKAVTQPPERDQLDGKAWYSSPYEGFGGLRLASVQAVGGKAPNAFGLHDMLGNVWEWTQDAWRADAYVHHALYNPVATGTGEQRVIRGGSLRTSRHMTRCEARAWLPAQESDAAVGLRVVRDR